MACRRYNMQGILAIVIIVGFSFACYNTETLTGMFGKEQSEICESENCINKDKSQAEAAVKDAVLRPASPGGQPKLQLHDHHHCHHHHEASNLNIDSSSPKDIHRKKTDPEAINLIITFTNAAHIVMLQEKFTLTVSSLLKHATVPLIIHVIGDDKSQLIATEILRKSAKHAKSTYSVVHLDVEKLALQLKEVVVPMQDHFSYKKGAYYSEALFFLSVALHKVMPDHMDKVIMIDCDLKFKADIKELYDRFDLFEEDNLMGIGRELQPVYRHSFASHRAKHPGTRIGEPPPDGLTGFNSGVLLLHLDRIRQSQFYNSLLNRDAIEKLTEEFDFKGNLGDQDFFTLLNMKHERLFHVLPCTWNRQLCTWWKDKGYEAVFDDYFRCEGRINIYHGNCNTRIPDD